MNEFFHRRIAWVVGGLGVLLAASLVVAVAGLGRSASLASDLDDVESALAQAQSDLAALEKNFEQLQGGTALFSAQVTAFQDQLAGLAPGVAVGIGEAIEGLDTFAASTLEFQVPISEDIPINTTLDLNRTITVPIQTTITIAGPFGVDIPLNVTVPVQLNLPVDLEVSFAIDEQIPIAANVPIDLQLPISIDIADTELATLVASLRVGLSSMADILSGLS